MLSMLVAQILALGAGACIDGTIVSCSLPGCTKAYKECVYPGFGPCECWDPEPTSCGHVAGSLRFYQWQGGFCPTTRDCTGASYLQAEFATNVPIRDTKFQILSATGEYLGSGTTDANGAFAASWCAQGTLSSINAQVRWRAEHKDSRFNVRNANGAAFALNSNAFQLTAGTTSGTPQQLAAPIVWGGPGAPNRVANYYDGAWRTWNSLRVSNLVLSAIANLEIRADSPVCQTSCAVGADNRIFLDANAAWAPQARVMHEMGHIVSYRASRDGGYDFSGWYCHPLTGGGCGWTFNTEEWSSVGFEEGFATFLGDTALYQKNATRPHTCFASAISCATGTFETEVTGTCATGQPRWPLSVTRYLWDAYDSNADRASDTIDRSLFEFIDVINFFPNGSANHAKNEPWCSSTVCDADGRSAEDFRLNWQAMSGVSSVEAYQSNCSPAGD